MDDTYLQVLTISGIIATCIGSGIAIVKACYWYQDRKPVFAYERFKERDIWFIRIQHNDKIIHRLSVTVDDSPLSFADKKGMFERVMRINEGQNFQIGKDIDLNSKVVIMYDKYRIKKKISDIPLAKDSS